MSRVLERGLMLDERQVEQYTEACSSTDRPASSLIRCLGTTESIHSLADLGCGPCTYHSKLYAAFPNAIISAYDGSPAMLAKATDYIDPKKTFLHQANISDIAEYDAKFDFVFSSLALHQLADPLQLWTAVKMIGRPGAKFAVFDLLRVEGEAAQHLVDRVAPKDIYGEVFREDFKNSLRAAFTVDELIQQLIKAGLTSSIIYHVGSITEFKTVCVVGVLD